MILEQKQDIDAPAEFVFAKLSDFDGITRQALRRGIQVKRLDSLPEPGPGMSWQTKFEMRGRPREMQIMLRRFEAPNLMRAQSEMPGMDSEVTFELIELSRQRTRLHASIKLKPSSLTARLLVQSLKLARGKLNRRMRKRMGEFAAETGDEYVRRR